MNIHSLPIAFLVAALSVSVQPSAATLIDTTDQGSTTGSFGFRICQYPRFATFGQTSHGLWTRQPARQFLSLPSRSISDGRGLSICAGTLRPGIAGIFVRVVSYLKAPRKR